MLDMIELNKKYLLICEGRDCLRFLTSYFSFLAEQGDVRFKNCIQLHNMGGNSELSNALQAIRSAAGFENIHSLLIIRDAEMDAQAALQSVQSTLAKLNLPVPMTAGVWEGNQEIKVAYLLFPECSKRVQKGTLEDLCIDILNLSQISNTDIQLVKEWMNKLSVEYGKQWSHAHKSKLYLCFSINNQFVGKKLGEAADAHAFDWNSGRLKSLKDCIEQGF